MPGPNPGIKHPIPLHPRVGFLKPLVDQPNIEIGDFTYYDDPDGPDHFVEKCVLHHYDFIGDRLVPGALVFAFGYLAFRSRVSGVYLSIITQALTFALMLAFFRNDMGFGGNNGLTDFKELLGFDLQAPATRAGLFVASALALGGGYLLARAVVRSRAGHVLIAVRDAESRSRFLGYRVEHYKLAVFVLSAVLTGIAGALYVPQVGIINPGEFAPLNSIEMVVWVALGGRGTLYGAALGAGVVNYLKTVLTGALPEVWLFFLGGLFMLVTVALPLGLVGLRARRRSAA